MFTISIKPQYKEIISLIDILIDEPGVLVKNPKLVRRLGIHAKELRRQKLLHISPDPELKETSIVLKCSNYYTPGLVTKKKSANHTTDYIFNTVGIPKITLPETPEF